MKYIFSKFSFEINQVVLYETKSDDTSGDSVLQVLLPIDDIHIVTPFLALCSALTFLQYRLSTFYSLRTS